MNRRNLLFIGVIIFAAICVHNAGACWLYPVAELHFDPHHYDTSSYVYCVRKNNTLGTNGSFYPDVPYWPNDVRSYDDDDPVVERVADWQDGIKKWEWDFDDGTTYSEFNNWSPGDPCNSGDVEGDTQLNGVHDHVYDTSGEYTLGFWVQDDDVYEQLSSVDHWGYDTYDILVFDMDIDGPDSIVYCSSGRSLVEVDLTFEPAGCTVGWIELYTSGCIKVWSDEDGTSLLVDQDDDYWCPTCILPETVWVEAVSGGTGRLQMGFNIFSDDDNDQIELIGKYFTATAVTVESVEIKEGSSSTPDICEEVTFEVETDPAGYEQFVQWSGGGCPDSEGQGETFTTVWACIGLKTVTATLCSSSISENVTVGLPDDCGTTRDSDHTIDWNDDEDLEYQGWIDGRYGLMDCGEDSLAYDVKFVYDNCAWVCDISNLSADTDIYVAEPGSGDPPVCPNSVDSADSKWCDDLPVVLEHLRDTDDDYDSGPPLVKYWSYDAMVDHERQHVSDWHKYYKETLADAINYCETEGSAGDSVDLHIEIECGDELTHSCQTVLQYYQGDVDAALEAAYDEAMDLMDDPSTPDFIECEVSAWEEHAEHIDPILDDLEDEVCN